MELGISSWSVPWAIGVPGYPPPASPLGVMGLLAKAAESDGVRVVQIADNLPLEQLSDPEQDALREGARDRGLALEAGTRGLDPDHLRRYIEIANRIGARVLRTVVSGSRLGLERLAAAEAAIREVVPLLDRTGVTLAFENNEAFAAAEYSALIRRISHPRVRICLDTANSLGRPEVLETVVGALAEHAAVLHAKDFAIRRVDTRMGFSVTGAPVGEGRVDFDYVLGELRRRGRTGISVIVEHWLAFAGSIEETVRLEEAWYQKSVRFLASRLKGGGDGNTA